MFAIPFFEKTDGTEEIRCIGQKPSTEEAGEKVLRNAVIRINTL